MSVCKVRGREERGRTEEREREGKLYKSSTCCLEVRGGERREGERWRKRKAKGGRDGEKEGRNLEESQCQLEKRIK